jgi:hypothetical protein
MDIKQLFGAFFTLAGAAILIFAVVAALGGVNSFFGLAVVGWESLIVGILGFIFFSTGINLLKSR